MKKYFLLVVLISHSCFSQMTFTPGMQWEGGMSTIRLTGDPVLAPDGSEFKLKPGFTFGLAFCGDLNFKSGRGGLGASFGVQQLRSPYKYYTDVTPPRYELNYMDLNIRMFYRGQKPEARTREIISMGFTTSYLFSAWRVYNTGADLISDEFGKLDFAFQFEVGVERQLKRNDILRFSINSNAGLVQIFSGAMHSVGIEGKTATSQLSVYYILGKRPKE